MISNILIGLGIAVFGYFAGGISGALMVTNALVKVDKMYEAETGNSFVKWVFDTQNTVRKHRIDKVYAAE